MNALIHHPRRALALGVAIAIALIALLPGTWAEAQTGTAGSIPPIVTSCPEGQDLVGGVCSTAGTPQTFTPTSSGSISMGGGGAPGDPTLTVTACCFAPGDTVTVTGNGFEPNEDVTITFTTSPLASRMGRNALGEQRVSILDATATRSEVKARQSSAASAYAVVQLLGLFDLELTDAAGNASQPGNPVTMVFDLSPEQLALLPGGDLGSVGLASHNEASDTWDPVTCTVTGAAQVSCVLPHFSTWALYSVQQVLDGPPPAQTGATPGAPTPADTGMGTESAASNTLAIVLGLVALAGILGAGSRVVLGRRRA